MAPYYGLPKGEDATEASWEAGKGAVIGATKWGAGAAVLGVIGFAMSPIYKGTTIQFKLYVMESNSHLAL